MCTRTLNVEDRQLVNSGKLWDTTAVTMGLANRRRGLASRSAFTFCADDEVRASPSIDAPNHLDGFQHYNIK
jgi:hypothetical protein